MDENYIKFLDTINSCAQLLEPTESLINIGNIYAELEDYPDELKLITACICRIHDTIRQSFSTLLFPAIVQHIKHEDDRLDLICINPETREIYYAEKGLNKPGFWLIHIAEYDPIMHSATLVHKQFAGWHAYPAT
jgi:hypothetical protein